MNNREIEILSIAYLMGRTGRRWGVTIKNEHLGFQIKCTCGDWTRLTSCIDFHQKLIEEVGIYGAIGLQLDEIAHVWERDIRFQ